MTLVFDNMSNLVLNVFSGSLLFLKFIPYLKSTLIVNDVNTWTNGVLTLLMRHPFRAFLAYMIPLYVILETQSKKCPHFYRSS